MNEFRRGWAVQAFNKMDASGVGKLDITDIKINYNAKKHPDVMMGKRSETEVLYDFLDTFEAEYAMQHPEGFDRNITIEKWLEY